MSLRSLGCTTLVTFVASLILMTAVADAQRISAKKKFEVSGMIRKVKPGNITVEDSNGSRRVYKVQDKDEDAVSLGGDFIVSLPATIKVSGTLPVKLLEPGMVIKFKGQVNRAGKTKGKITSLDVIEADESKWKVEAAIKPEGLTFAECDIIGQIVMIKKGVVNLAVPKTRFSRSGRLKFPLDEKTTFKIQADDLNRVRKGDKVKKMQVVEFSTGDLIVKEIDVELDSDREAATISFHDQLMQKFAAKSDKPAEPREFRSKEGHFILVTDISDRQAHVLMGKLERMYGLIRSYYSKGPREPILCYVVKDLNKFQGRLDQTGVKKIQEGAGVTISATLTLGKKRRYKSIVYSCDKQDVVQHEAVHAFCAMAFGSAGPVWYAEGMAEMGQYWEPGELAVNIDPVIIEFLTKNPDKRKPLAEIIKAGQITGDSWQAYAWRWALCHLLASNPNYSGGFRALGIGMMKEQKGATFDAVYGKYSKEIEFEYDFFCRNFGNGYRVDLSYWDWNIEPQRISGTKRTKKVVKAQRGWQATNLMLEKGKSYDAITVGKWKVEKDGKQLEANGYEDGTGRLVGAIYKDYKLSKPFDLGADGSFVASQDGQLYVRCQDDWLELGDNEGEITAHFRATPNK